MIEFFGRLRIRSKITLLMSAMVAAISLAILLYFPAKFRESARNVMRETAHSTTEIVARSLSDPLHSDNPVAAATFLAALRQHDELAYAIVTDARGRITGSFNEQVADATRFREVKMGDFQRTGMERVSETRGGATSDPLLYQTLSPVRFEGKQIGSVYLGFSLRRLENEVEATRGRIAVIALGIFLLGIALANALSTLVTGPLRRIVATTEEIAAGARGLRAKVPFPDEVGVLANSINAMVSQLESSQDALEELNRNLETRVQERSDKLLHESEVRHRAEMALRSSEERYESLVERNPAGVYIMSLDGSVIASNPACATLLGYVTTDEFIGAGGIRYVDSESRDRMLDLLRRSGSIANFEAEVYSRDGGKIWVIENARVKGEGEEALVEGILLDVSDRKKAEIEIEHRAYHDALTLLPNRLLLDDRLQMAVAQARRIGSELALFFIDLDDLKVINDTLGHEAGDSLLKHFAKRLASVTDASDTIARIGGDEFTILMPTGSTADAQAKADSLLEALTLPFALDHEEIYVSASIGIAMFPRDGEDAEALLRSADRTMYRVKEGGGNAFRFSERGESSRGIRRSSLQEELTAGLERGEFIPFYQPQFELESRYICGVEALVRWNHPEGILLNPSGFITLAEQTGLISALGKTILEQSAVQVKKWQQAGLHDLRLSVNVSPRQLHQRDFIGTVKRVLAESRFDSWMLELELTESIAMHRGPRITEMLEELRTMGIAIAVDDFGTGQSSLSYLKQFAFDTVKIDKSFVHDMVSDRNDHSIVSAVIHLANQLDLRTVAEGVESEEQCSLLQEMGCRFVQGFLFSKPLSAADFEARYLAPVTRQPSPVTS